MDMCTLWMRFFFFCAVSAHGAVVLGDIYGACILSLQHRHTYEEVHSVQRKSCFRDSTLLRCWSSLKSIVMFICLTPKLVGLPVAGGSRERERGGRRRGGMAAIQGEKAGNCKLYVDLLSQPCRAVAIFCRYYFCRFIYQSLFLLLVICTQWVTDLSLGSVCWILYRLGRVSGHALILEQESNAISFFLFRLLVDAWSEFLLIL